MARCVECGFRGEMASRREDLPYRGLPCVTLRNMEVRTCPQCGEEYYVYPRFGQLHDMIRDLIVAKRSGLTPAEFKFLRKSLGWSSQDTATRMGVDPATVSRWENGKRTIGPSADRLIRALAMLNDPIADYSAEVFEFNPEPTDEPRAFELKGSRWAVAC